MTSKILFFLWLSAITFISLVDYSSASGLGLSKAIGTGFWLHAIGYFIAGLLFILAFGKKGQKYLFIALTALFLLGVLFEIAQLRIPSRSYNPVDIAANGLGLIAFYVCYNLTRIRSNKSLRKGAETPGGRCNEGRGTRGTKDEVGRRREMNGRGWTREDGWKL